jgi:hypothetical protein
MPWAKAGEIEKVLICLVEKYKKAPHEILFMGGFSDKF